jgi:hypothetical protein
MLANHKEADEVFAQTRQALLLFGILALIAVAGFASVVFSLVAA